AVAGVDWWTERRVGTMSSGVEVSPGRAKGERATIALGPAAGLVLYGGSGAALAGVLRPLLRLRWNEEQLTEQATRLARLTEALDDFAGLVAHDVRSALLTALREEDPREGLTHALGLVDSILEAVHTDTAASGLAQVADCVQQAISDLGET